MYLTTLVTCIKTYNEAYRKGEPQVTDEEYDQLIEELREKDPENDLLKKAIIEEAEERKQSLPFPMMSLEKIKEIDELKKFIRNNWNPKREEQIVITLKYDGISLLVDEESQHCWTRGNGEEGQRSDEHFLRMNSKGTESLFAGFTYGEAIFKKESFLKNKGEYKSARNCVAGLFNSPNATPLLSHVDYVRYGIMDEKKDKSVQLESLSRRFSNSAKFWKTSAAMFLENDDESILSFLNELFDQNGDVYKCDGLVIEIDDAKKRDELGRLSNGNPKYAIAYKNPEWAERADTIVKEIEWSISKDGKSKPVIIFDPIELCGATVQRATAHNAKYLIENNICVGALITITRSGDVIPKHIKTIKYNSSSWPKEMHSIFFCSSCEELLIWNNTAVELICSNPNCKEKRISQLVFFFSTLGTEEFGEPTVRKFYETGYKTPSAIMNLESKEMKEIPGIGISLAKTLSSQFESYKTEGVSFAKLATAYNAFEGTMGEKTCQLILDSLSEKDLLDVKNYNSPSVNDLQNIPGVGFETACAFQKGLQKMNSIDDYTTKISMWNKPKVKKAENAMAVCFSGVRDKVSEERLELNGHKVVSGVSSKTTHLVMKSIGSGSSKEEKALKLGIQTMTLEDFKKLLDEILL